MLLLALRNSLRRPLRNGLTIGGLAIAVAVLVCLSSFGNGYRRALNAEIDRMGVQLLLVPLGCPYDAAARVLKGKALDVSLPESALVQARQDPAVAVAEPGGLEPFRLRAQCRRADCRGLVYCRRRNGSRIYI